MISKKTKYALKALIYLASKYDRGPILIADLASHEQIPKKFLEQILLNLKNNGILLSKKGKGGGYYLGKEPGTISMGKIIRLLEGPLAPVPCVSETAYEKCEECGNENTCGVRLLMKGVRDAIAKIYDGTTLGDLLEQIDKAEQEDKAIIDFCI